MSEKPPKTPPRQPPSDEVIDAVTDENGWVWTTRYFNEGHAYQMGLTLPNGASHAVTVKLSVPFIEIRPKLRYKLRRHLQTWSISAISQRPAVFTRAKDEDASVCAQDSTSGEIPASKEN